MEEKFSKKEYAGYFVDGVKHTNLINIHCKDKNIPIVRISAEDHIEIIKKCIIDVETNEPIANKKFDEVFAGMKEYAVNDAGLYQMLIANLEVRGSLVGKRVGKSSPVSRPTVKQSDYHFENLVDKREGFDLGFDKLNVKFKQLNFDAEGFVSKMAILNEHEKTKPLGFIDQFITDINGENVKKEFIEKYASAVRNKDKFSEVEITEKLFVLLGKKQVIKKFLGLYEKEAGELKPRSFLKPVDVFENKVDLQKLIKFISDFKNITDVNFNKKKFAETVLNNIPIKSRGDYTLNSIVSNYSSKEQNIDFEVALSTAKSLNLREIFNNKDLRKNLHVAPELDALTAGGIFTLMVLRQADIKSISRSDRTEQESANDFISKMYHERCVSKKDVEALTVKDNKITIDGKVFYNIDYKVSNNKAISI